MNEKIDNLENKRFGEWRVIKKTRPNTYGNTYWLVECSCGKSRELTGRSLIYGKSTHCGCKRTQKLSIHESQFSDFPKYNFKDETGHVYGELTPIKITRQNSKKEWYWLCTCSCGNTTEIRGSHLRSGAVSSCGCKMYESMRKINISHNNTYTKAYKRSIARKRKNRSKALDAWTPEMEVTLRELFPACVLCGITEQEHQEKYGTSLHVDHVRPLSRGHGLKPGNAAILCAKCNREKHDTPLNNLSADIRTTLLNSAQQFLKLWESL